MKPVFSSVYFLEKGTVQMRQNLHSPSGLYFCAISKIKGCKDIG